MPELTRWCRRAWRWTPSRETSTAWTPPAASSSKTRAHGESAFVPAIEVWDSPWDKLPALIQIVLEKRGFTEEAWTDEDFSLEESDETYRSGEMVGVDVGQEEFNRAFARNQPARINGYVLSDIDWTKGMPVHWFCAACVAACHVPLRDQGADGRRPDHGGDND